MEYPEHIKSGQARTAYAHGYADAKAGRDRSPYGGKISRAAYEAGYAKGLEEAA